MIEEATLLAIERDNPEGLSSAQILQICQAQGISLSEATLRKYVQLGLLPRSVRVGQKGKHRGSMGLYPTRVIRRLLLIKTMMAQSLTIEQIQREFLLFGSEIEQIEESLSKLFKKIRQTIRDRAPGGSGQAAVSLVEHEMDEAERVSEVLISRLERIETQLKGRWENDPSKPVRQILAVS